MGDETKLFRNKLKEKLPQFLFSQIESHQTAPGYPDTDYLLKNSLNITGKIELKYSDKIPYKIDLRKNQVVWLRRYARLGGRCFIAIKIGQDLIYVWEGKYALELYQGTDIWSIPHWEFNLRKNGWEQFGIMLQGDILIDKLLVGQND